MDIQSSYKKIAIYFLLFVIVYISDDTLLFGTSSDVYMYSKFKYLLYYLLTVVLIINVRRISKSNAILLMTLVTLIAITSISNSDFRGGYVYQTLIIVLSFLLVKKINFSVFAATYCRYIYLFGIASLVAYVLAILFPFIINYFPVITNISGLDSHNLIVAVIHGDYGHGLRNTGIFREPGVYMIYLNIALMLSLFYENSLNKRYVFIYLLCIATTVSTAGIIVAAGILLASVFYRKDMFSKGEKRLIYLLPFFFVLVLIYNIGLSDAIFGKLNADSDKYVSTLARVASFFVPLVNFMDNPFSGSGLTSFNIEFEKQSMIMFGIPLSADGTATNTITNKFATYGLLFGTIFIYALFRFSKKIFGKNVFLKYVSFVLLLAMFSNEDMRYSLLFNMIVFYGLIKDKSLQNQFIQGSK
ncbi:hypothetical protein [Labilibaculum manganireducens]|uniref:hypothetical protein n=1 Tax=Labilibaculum manganireducens TaxID=1940525 RepID=UPI0029F4F27C|nr:hypothetical protein [Labilibaculum manganireducens]